MLLSAQSQNWSVINIIGVFAVIHIEYFLTVIHDSVLCFFFYVLRI